MSSSTENGIVNMPSSHSVDQTVEKLTAMLQAKGVALFALVDHSGEAAKAGMTPSSAIDLPLKILVWEDGQSKVWISYNSPKYLQKRHDLPQELMPNIAVVETLAAKAAD
jgi:uncharacterized protein (DUF302 family)